MLFWATGTDRRDGSNHHGRQARAEESQDLFDVTARHPKTSPVISLAASGQPLQALGRRREARCRGQAPAGQPYRSLTRDRNCPAVSIPSRFSHGRFVLTRPAKQFARQWRLGLWGRKCGKTTKRQNDKTTKREQYRSRPGEPSHKQTSRVPAHRAPTRSCSFYSFKQAHHERAVARQVSATVRTTNEQTPGLQY